MAHYSASQIKTFSLCARKWHLDKWSSVPTPPAGAGAELGRAAWVFRKEPDRQEITLVHAYYGTKRQSFKLVKAKVSRERIERQYQSALAFVKKNMAHLSTSEINSFEIAGDASACGAYGGCGYLNICNPNQGAQTMPTLEELIAKRKTPTAEVVAPEAPSRETPPAPDAPESPTNRLVRVHRRCWRVPARPARPCRRRSSSSSNRTRSCRRRTPSVRRRLGWRRRSRRPQ